MKASVTTGGTSNTMGDIDDAASKEQVSNVVHPPMPSAAAYKDIDEDHGGTNVIVHPEDGAASANTMTTHESSCPTAAEMGIN